MDLGGSGSNGKMTPRRRVSQSFNTGVFAPSSRRSRVERGMVGKKTAACLKDIKRKLNSLEKRTRSREQKTREGK